MGASEILPIGLGDDQSRLGYFTELDPWLSNMLSALKVLFPMMSEKFNGVATNEDSYDLTLDYLSSGSSKADSIEYVVPRDCRPVGLIESTDSSCNPNSNQFLLDVPVLVNERITASDWNQDVRHLVLDLNMKNSTVEGTRVMGAGAPGAQNCRLQNSQSPSHAAGIGGGSLCSIASAAPAASYLAGDIACVFPENDPSWVQRALAILSPAALLSDQDIPPGKSKEIWISLHRRDTVEWKRETRLGNTECTIENLFKKCLDICGIPQVRIAHHSPGSHCIFSIIIIIIIMIIIIIIINFSSSCCSFVLIPLI